MFFKRNQIALSTLLLSLIGSVCAHAQNNTQTGYISPHNNTVQNVNVVEHPANSFVELDFSITEGESWNTKDAPNNIVVNCINGSIITGFETSNIVIQTEGHSFFSEAIIYFSDSDRGNNGIEFSVGGTNNNNSGTSSFSTSSILDITDLGIPDVESLSDNKFYLQFYEVTDDIPNGIDARYTSGKLKVWGVDLEATASCPYVASVENADIAVTYNADNTQGLSIGDNLTLEIVATNTSTNTATNVVIENTLSESLDFIDLSCDNGYSTTDVNAAQSVTIGDVLANSSITCTINTEVLSITEITATVNITSDNDSDISNNSTTLMIMAAAESVPVSNWFMLSVLFLLLSMSAFYSTKQPEKK